MRSACAVVAPSYSGRRRAGKMPKEGASAVCGPAEHGRLAIRRQGRRAHGIHRSRAIARRDDRSVRPAPKEATSCRRAGPASRPRRDSQRSRSPEPPARTGEVGGERVAEMDAGRDRAGPNTVAEAVGFEPTGRVNGQRFSRPSQSTTLPSLRRGLPRPARPRAPAIRPAPFPAGPRKGRESLTHR